MESVNRKPLQEALDDNTSGDRLRELFFTNRDPQIKQAIAQNLNTPLDLLLRLRDFYPIEAINNSSLLLLFSEKPKSLQPIALGFLRYFIKNPQTPVSFLEWFLSNDPRDLNYDQSWQLPNWFLNCIAHDFSLEELNNALTSRIYFHHLRNHDLPENILELLANISLNKNIIGIGRLLAKDSCTASHILDILAQSKDYKLRYLIAQHPNASPMVLTKIAAESNEITPQEKRSEYIRIPLLRFILKHPNCPDSVFKILAQDWNKKVRNWVEGSEAQQAK